MEKPVLDLQDFGIHALEHVAKPGKGTVVFAHGITCDLSEDKSETRPGVFDLMVEHLIEQGIGTLRFDFRGHGDSDEVDGYVSISSEAADLHSVIDYLDGVGRSVSAVVGSSFGACAVSVVVAERLPDVPALVLLNPVLRPLENFLAPGSDWFRQKFSPENLSDLDEQGFLLLEDDFPLGRKFFEDAKTIKPTELLREYPGKLAIWHGTEDSYVPFAYSKEFAHQMKAKMVSITGSEHGFGQLKDRYFVAENAANFLSETLASSLV